MWSSTFVDEFSYRKRHHYLTVVVDHDRRRVVWAGKGRSAETLEAFFDLLGPAGCERIELVTADLASSWQKALRARVPHARVVFDRFHVERLAADALDEVRRAEQHRLGKQAKQLKGMRYPLLKHPARLKPGEERRLAALRRQNRALGRAYELKECLAAILGEATPEDGQELLDEWLAWASRSRLAPFVKLAKTVRKHAAGILAYLDTKMTNGIVEGINNKLRVIARRAYGFHSHGALISMLFLCCGRHPTGRRLYPHEFEEIRFFSARLATLSRAARLELVERGGELSIRRQCALLGINRSSVYYTPREERAENLALMRRMDELSLQYPFYGSRQMARHLGREGVSVGRRRVRRLMRLMGLEAVYRKPRTSAAQPGHRIYPYLLRELTIDRPNQVWCADITYIPVTAGFLYLVAVMDWASRHVLAWRLSNTMDTGFCIEALEAALRTGTPEIFNTDQGAQLTSTTFTERVLAAGARCSMDGRGRCLDNVFIERLWRSLKYEAVYLHELVDGFEAERVIGAWMTFYSDVRPHSALGGRTPAEAYGEERAA